MRNWTVRVQEPAYIAHNLCLIQQFLQVVRFFDRHLWVPKIEKITKTSHIFTPDFLLTWWLIGFMGLKCPFQTVAWLPFPNGRVLSMVMCSILNFISLGIHGALSSISISTLSNSGIGVLLETFLVTLKKIINCEDIEYLYGFSWSFFQLGVFLSFKIECIWTYFNLGVKI